MPEPNNPSTQQHGVGSSWIVFECHVRLRDRPEETKTLTLEAPSREAAIQKLSAQGYMVVKINEPGNTGRGRGKGHPGKASGGGLKGPSFSFLNTVSTREIIFFAVQLSTLLKAGIPLLRALEIIEKGITNVYFKQVIKDLRKKVSEGGTFSQALRSYARVFPWIWVNLVEVGETTGKLPECLEEIAHYQESSVRIKSKVATAFFYPGVLTAVVIGAVTFLLLFIVPKFSEIFAAQNMTLPVITQIVINVSNLIKSQFPLVTGCVVALIVTFIYTSKIPSIKMFYDRIVLRVPLFGAILVQVAVVRFARSLSVLLRSGVQIIQGLEISGRLVENMYLESGIRQVAREVKGGQGLGVQFEIRKIFPVFMTQLITVGEESGQIDKFLDLLSKYYEEQVDTFLARLTTLMEPFLLVSMGGIIGTIVIAMFLPIIKMSTGGG